MNRKQLKGKIKELPVNISIAGAALLLSLAEGGMVFLDEILKGPSRGLGKSYNRIIKTGTLWDYYDELKDMQKNSARTILWRLQNKGLVKKKEKRYGLTLKGLKMVKIFQKSEIRETQWDGKWRLVMFDIPEKKREWRDWLRWQLITWEYKPLQKSVFIGKQPLEEDFYSGIADRGLNHFIRLMTIGDIDVDDEEMLNF